MVPMIDININDNMIGYVDTCENCKLLQSENASEQKVTECLEVLPNCCPYCHCIMEENESTPNSPADVKKLEAEDDIDDSKCGIGKCTPRWMQIFNNPKAAVIFLSWFTLLQGLVVNGFNNTNTTSIERRFNLPSYKVAMVSSAYDLSAGFFVILISYYGAHSHKPRLLATAALIMGVGSLTMSLPHFFTGLYEYGKAVSDTCSVSGNSTAEVCTEEQSGLQNWLYMLIFGQILHGIGGTTLYTLGPVFLDDNVEAKSSPMYIGIMYGFSAFGPAIGYILGGQLLDLYVDIFEVDTSTVNLTTSDPRWVGAWWIGFFFASFLFISVAGSLMLFPKQLRGTKELQKKRVSQAHQDGGEQEVSRQGFGTSFRDMPTAAKVILKNPTFIFVTLAGCTEGILTSGFATFMPKFIQNQYFQTAGWAAMLGGFVAVPGAAGGQFAGGFIAHKMKLKVKGMLRLSIIACFCSLLVTPVFWGHCTNLSFAGVTANYFNRNLTTANISSSCNTGCGCNSLYYTPVCGKDGLQYFSSCHAGCASSLTNENGQKVYGNCSCIDYPAGSHGMNDSVIMAVDGECVEGCSLLYVFLPFGFLTIFLTFLSATPATSVILRCIPDSQRSFGMGLQWMFIRFLATVPGPILFGAIIDSSCVIWQEKCEEQGSCWLYDNFKMSSMLFILASCLKFVSIIFFSLANYFYKPPEVVKLTRTSTDRSILGSSTSDIDFHLNNGTNGKYSQTTENNGESPPVFDDAIELNIRT